MAANDIFRCNRCCTKLRIFENDSTPQNNYLTTCMHLLCERCHAGDRTKCAHCGKEAKSCRITQDMPFTQRILFLPFENIHKKIKQAKSFQDAQSRFILQRHWDSCHPYIQNIAKLNEGEKMQIKTDMKMMNESKRLRSIMAKKNEQYV